MIIHKHILEDSDFSKLLKQNTTLSGTHPWMQISMEESRGLPMCIHAISTECKIENNHSACISNLYVHSWITI